MGGCAVMVATFTTDAFAAPPVEGLTVGLERTFGFSLASRSYRAGGADVSHSSVGFSLGLAGFSMGVGGNAAVLPVYNRPRLSVDYVMNNALSLGGAIGFATGTYSTESEVGNTSVKVDAPDATMFLLAPRAGYMFGLTEHFAIWPRGGFTFVGISMDDNDDDTDDDPSATAWALSVDVPFVYAIGPMGAFLAPSFDLGLGGSIDVGNASPSTQVHEFGIQFGFFGVF